MTRHTDAQHWRDAAHKLRRAAGASLRIASDMRNSAQSMADAAAAMVREAEQADLIARDIEARQ